MRYDISIPQFVGPDGVDAEALASHLRRCEEAGFTGAWVMEQAIGPTPTLPPLETLSYVAALTTRIRLGVAVLVTSLNSPMHLAGSLAGVDLLSHGRLDVGVSAGGGFRDFAAFGIDSSTFVSRFTEGLELMKAAWSGRVDLDGRFFTVHADIAPRPVQQPHPPIWFGAGARAALRRAVRHGDAFMGAGSVTTERFADQVRNLRAALDEADRDPADFPVGKRVYLAIDDDPAAARAAVGSGLRKIYGDAVPDLDRVAVAGTPDDVVAGVQAVIDAGAETIVLNPLAEDAVQLERLVADVLPRLP